MDWGIEYNNWAISHTEKSTFRTRALKEALTQWGHRQSHQRVFFLKADAQDETTGTDRKRMKCLSCGHGFARESYDSCPECFSSDTEDVTDEKVDGYR